VGQERKEKKKRKKREEGNVKGVRKALIHTKMKISVTIEL